MVYMGSKRLIAKHILPIILKDRKEDQWYVEPFVGGFNSIDKVTGNRIGNDNNHYLIAMVQALQDGWVPPPHITKEEYLYVKENQDENLPLTAFVGLLCSFGGKWFNGYAGNYKHTSKSRIGEVYRSLMKQVPLIKDIVLYTGNYYDVPIPDNSTIYCDPPYQGITGYKDSFNHEYFWDWCRKLTKEGHQVFISEYNAPDDFECVWEKEVVTKMNQNKPSVRVERLFKLKEG